MRSSRRSGTPVIAMFDTYDVFRNDMEPRHRRQAYYGYAFESYCTTSTPGRRENTGSHAQGWGGDVNTNVQWCSVVKTKLGDRRIVIGGEVDCVRGMLSYLVVDSGTQYRIQENTLETRQALLN